MASPFFRFKQFAVWHDRCAMKVGTDGVLLGAWCPLPENTATLRILDVGTGSGLIALMLAQRCATEQRCFQTDAIDIDSSSAGQAADNFNRSPWANCMKVACSSLQDWNSEPYHLIVSNPPYFVDSLKNPDENRHLARHTDTLSYADLLANAWRLLEQNGQLTVILPADAEADFLQLAHRTGFSLTRLTRVFSKPGKPQPIRMLAALSKTQKSYDEIVDNLYIEGDASPRSDQYASLTRDFYL